MFFLYEVHQIKSHFDKLDLNMPDVLVAMQWLWPLCHIGICLTVYKLELLSDILSIRRAFFLSVSSLPCLRHSVVLLCIFFPMRL